FENMPELHWHYGYYGVWVVMLSIAGGLVTWFWRRGWLERDAAGPTEDEDAAPTPPSPPAPPPAPPPSPSTPSSPPPAPPPPPPPSAPRQPHHPPREPHDPRRSRKIDVEVVDQVIGDPRALEHERRVAPRRVGGLVDGDDRLALELEAEVLVDLEDLADLAKRVGRHAFPLSRARTSRPA